MRCKLIINFDGSINVYVTLNTNFRSKESCLRRGKLMYCVIWLEKFIWLIVATRWVDVEQSRNGSRGGGDTEEGDTVEARYWIQSS
jgi:hypothetical protein